MAISIDWATKIITVPQADLTLVGLNLYELDVDTFRLALRDLEDDFAGMTFPATHTHNTEVVLSGVTYARTIEIINGYTITFEDGQYRVSLVGANNNIADVANLNQVSIASNNSAGLQIVNTGSGLTTDQSEALDLILAATAGRVVVSTDGLTVTLYAADGVTPLRVLNVSADLKTRTPQ